MDSFRSLVEILSCFMPCFLASGIQIEVTGKALIMWGNVGKEGIESISDFIWVRYDHIVR